jgi:hypothetical protein
MAKPLRLSQRGLHQCRSDAAPAKYLQHFDIVNTGNTSAAANAVSPTGLPLWLVAKCQTCRGFTRAIIKLEAARYCLLRECLSWRYRSAAFTPPHCRSFHSSR